MEITVTELKIYHTYLMEGAQLCSNKFRFGIRVLENAEMLEAKLKKIKDLAKLSTEALQYEKDTKELWTKFHTRQITQDALSTGLDKLEEECKEAIEEYKTYSDTIVDIEPTKINFDLVPIELLDGVENQSKVAFNLMRALVKLKIV